MERRIRFLGVYAMLIRHELPNSVLNQKEFTQIVNSCSEGKLSGR